MMVWNSVLQSAVHNIFAFLLAFPVIRRVMRSPRFIHAVMLNRSPSAESDFVVDYKQIRNSILAVHQLRDANELQGEGIVAFFRRTHVNLNNIARAAQGNIANEGALEASLVRMMRDCDKLNPKASHSFISDQVERYGLLSYSTAEDVARVFGREVYQGNEYSRTYLNRIIAGLLRKKSNQSLREIVAVLIRDESIASLVESAARGLSEVNRDVALRNLASLFAVQPSVSLRLIGTSNSLIRGGLSDGLRNRLYVKKLDNRSIGASLSCIAPYHMQQKFMENEYILVDFCVNDELFSSTKKKYDVERAVSYYKYMVANSNGFGKILFLMLAHQNFALRDSEFRSAVIRAMREFGIACIDINVIIKNIVEYCNVDVSVIYMDPAHIQPDIAKEIGEHIAESIYFDQSINRSPEFRQIQTDDTFFIPASDFIGAAGEFVRLSTSQASAEIVRLQLGDEFGVCLQDGDVIDGILINGVAASLGLTLPDGRVLFEPVDLELNDDGRELVLMCRPTDAYSVSAREGEHPNVVVRLKASLCGKASGGNRHVRLDIAGIVGRRASVIEGRYQVTDNPVSRAVLERPLSAERLSRICDILRPWQPGLGAEVTDKAQVNDVGVELLGSEGNGNEALPEAK